MVTKIYKGDSTNAGGRAILIALPEDENFDGEAVAFEFLGKRIVEENPEAGGSIRVEFTAEETARMPLGTHFARLSIIHAGAEHTVSATIPIKVTDDVAEVYGGDASTIYLTMRYCAGIPDLAEIDHAPKTANALASAFHALLQKLQGGVALSLALLCTACLGVEPKTAPIGDVPFTQPIVTNSTAAFAPMSHVEDRDNPHGVTARQIGALNANETQELISHNFDSVTQGMGLEPFINFLADERVLTKGGQYFLALGGGNMIGPLYIHSAGIQMDEWANLQVMGQPMTEVFATKEFVNDAVIQAGGFTPEMATNVARAVVAPHIANHDNPHGVTAAQVGARPDSWLPSPQEIGAIPQNLNSPYTISLDEFPLFFGATADGSESTEMAVTSDGVWISGLNVAGQLVKGGEDVATEPFVLAASNNLARVRLDIVLQTYPTQHYEIQRNGVKQTFDQVAALASDRDCYIKRANGIYHPTYVSAAEVMFDCVGTIQGLIETRRIHMVASTGAVTIGDLKVIADRDWVESLPTTYTNFSGTAFVALNQSVQTITTHGEQITITMPNAVAGGTRDFCVYINNEGSTDSPLWLPSGTYYGDEDCTNAVKSGIVTALYFTEMSGGKFMLGRRELVQISVSH